MCRSEIVDSCSVTMTEETQQTEQQKESEQSDVHPVGSVGISGPRMVLLRLVGLTPTVQLQSARLQAAETRIWYRGRRRTT